MAHQLFGDRFVQRGDAPAWHKLGIQAGNQFVSASEAYGYNPYHVELTPCYTEIGLAGATPFSVEQARLELAYQAIIRHPTPDDNQVRCFGIVGPEYKMITPTDLCAIWDEVVQAGIETLGALKEGRELFITVKLPSFAVNGDEHDNYMVLHAPWDGIHAYRVFTTPVRVVCNNTLMLGLEMAGEAFKIKHDGGSEKRLRMWLDGIVQRAEAKTKGITDTLTLMANVPLPDADADRLIERALPLPNQPRLTPDPATNAKREEAWELQAKAQRRTREQVKVLYQGMGYGMDIANTPYKLYNAGVEALDWAPVKKEKVAIADALFGGRADVKVDLFNVTFDYAMRHR